VKAYGNPARVEGVNAVGMSRQGLEAGHIGRLVDLAAGPHATSARLPADRSASPAPEPGIAWWPMRESDA